MITFQYHTSQCDGSIKGNDYSDVSTMTILHPTRRNKSNKNVPLSKSKDNIFGGALVRWGFDVMTWMRSQ